MRHKLIYRIPSNQKIEIISNKRNSQFVRHVSVFQHHFSITINLKILSQSNKRWHSRCVMVNAKNQKLLTVSMKTMVI